MRITKLVGWMLLIMCLGLAISPVQAWAHTDNSEGFSRITADSGKLHYELLLDYFEFGRVVDLEVPPNASQTVMSGKVEASRRQIQDYVNSNLHVYIDGIRVAGQVVQTSVEQKLNRYYARMVLDFPIDEGAQALEIHYGLFFEDNDPMHRNIATYEWKEKEGQVVFNSGEQDFHSGKSSLFNQVLRFIELGFHHIMIGYDHILFVIALVLGSRKIKDVFKIITVFTLAHSVTLGLTAFHLVSIPPEIVEPLIALSIAFVALESVMGLNSKLRILVVFAFGLIHGIGFAGALELTSAWTWSALLSLASFNIGVECGQALIIFLLFPLLIFVRRFQWSGWLQGSATAGILGFGLWWYFERMLG
ncbi:HupE/UreJ family protein [Paenibacillus solisilvae]|uniref:HupE/UreJ family protein n=1 Tax=Paenibacillus solisilvae TaxID=2486751 RepID=A0ABW0W7F1_9BACL